MLNSPKSGRSIYKEDIEKDDMPNSSRYHNRHLSDFLKELDITAGHSTGLYFTSPLDYRVRKVKGHPPLGWMDILRFQHKTKNSNRQDKSYMVYDAALLLFSKISALHHHHICSGLGNCRSYDKPQQLYQYI